MRQVSSAEGTKHSSEFKIAGTPLLLPRGKGEVLNLRWGRMFCLSFPLFPDPDESSHSTSADDSTVKLPFTDLSSERANLLPMNKEVYKAWRFSWDYRVARSSDVLLHSLLIHSLIDVFHNVCPCLLRLRRDSRPCQCCCELRTRCSGPPLHLSWWHQWWPRDPDQWRQDLPVCLPQRLLCIHQVGVYILRHVKHDYLDWLSTIDGRIVERRANQLRWWWTMFRPLRMHLLRGPHGRYWCPHQWHCGRISMYLPWGRLLLRWGQT